jgi:hypothetical protein
MSLTFQKPIPRLPQVGRRGAKVTGGCLMDSALVFRAEGGIHPGIYAERDGALQPVWLDHDSGVHVAPVAAGPLLAIQRMELGTIPPVTREIVFLRQGKDVLRVQGQSVGVNPTGTHAVVADLLHNTLWLVDLHRATATAAGKLKGLMHPMLPPLPSVDARGRLALCADATQELCNGSVEMFLLGEDMQDTLVDHAPAPTRHCGAFLPSGDILLSTMSMAEGPRFTLRRITQGGVSTEILMLPLTMPLQVPCVLDEHTAVLPLTVRGEEGRSYGPVDLHTVDLATGKTTQLTHQGDVNARTRLVDGALLAEGIGGVLWIPSSEVLN